MIIWIAFSVGGVAQFDVYPFILLNLAIRLQAAYAPPLILARSDPAVRSRQGARPRQLRTRIAPIANATLPISRGSNRVLPAAIATNGKKDVSA
jgi:hypothetical protein